MVAEELERLCSQGFVRYFDTVEEARAFLGEDPVLSKIGVMEKISNGVAKYRLVIDSKRSEVSASTRRFERTLLPRVLDVVYDGLDVLALHEQDFPGVPAELEFLIADFKDAFSSSPTGQKNESSSWSAFGDGFTFSCVLRKDPGGRL